MSSSASTGVVEARSNRALGRRPQVLPARGSSSVIEIALGLAVFVITAVVTWFRVPGSHRDRVWAEDANIFLAEAIERGPWNVLFEGYAGYQHLVPRTIVAVIFPFFDLSDYPVLVFAICSALTGAVAAAVFALARETVPFRPARVGLALVTGVLPLATQETVGNLADLHTYAMWLTPWLLLARPRTWRASVGWALLAFATVMTEIQSVFFVFLIAFGLRRADRRAWPIFGAFVIASVIQLLTAATVPRTPGAGPLGIPSTVQGWMINTVMPLVSADPQTIRQWAIDSGLMVALVILIPIVLATVLVLIFGSGRQRLLTITLLLGSAASYTGSAWANSGFWFDYANEPFTDLGIRLAVNIRYGVASGMMLIAVLFIAAAVIRTRWSQNFTARTMAWLIPIAIVAVLVYGCTTATSIRGWVDEWSPAVSAAAVECATSPGGTEIVLPVAPDRSVSVTCADVTLLTRR